MSGFTDYAGIDYGLGTTNLNAETGIRYGVISQHSINPDCLEDFEDEYGDPHCPKCGSEVPALTAENDVDEELPQYSGGCADYICVACGHTLDSQDVFPEERIGFSYRKDGYKMSECLDSDIFVYASPFYTWAQLCSPCVPGAGNLDNPMESGAGGAKTYCLGHDWFEDGAPYAVFDVKTDKQVFKEVAK
jgi:DNA-directed RNA polymerase subunit RPC12/RpoP